MSAAPPTGSGGTADRVRCAYCGANNFPAAPTCWQCQRPLKPLRAGGAAPVPSVDGLASSVSPDRTAPRAVTRTAGGGGGLAPKAAAALGLLFPWAGLPIGLAFLMLDDPRHARLGWAAIGWSVAGTVLSVIAFIPPLLTVWPLVKSMLSHPGGLPGIGPPGGSAPGGLPSLGGGDGLLLPHVFLPLLACAFRPA